MEENKLSVTRLVIKRLDNRPSQTVRLSQFKIYTLHGYTLHYTLWLVYFISPSGEGDTSLKEGYQAPMLSHLDSLQQKNFSNQRPQNSWQIDTYKQKYTQSKVGHNRELLEIFFQYLFLKYSGNSSLQTNISLKIKHFRLLPFHPIWRERKFEKNTFILNQ